MNHPIGMNDVTHDCIMFCDVAIDEGSHIWTITDFAFLVQKSVNFST
jgi:hypothetical protein